MSKKIIAVIPARMGSSRFPGKPLANILDLPMIEHVRRRVELSELIDEVYVATCDQEIMDVVHENGGKAVMTSDRHQRCTDRVEEAVINLDCDIVAVISGDEPMFDPKILDPLLLPMIHDDQVQCTNIVSVIRDEADLSDKDIVKAVLDQKNYVMYFSRSPIPFLRVKGKSPLYRQTGLAAFTKSFLKKFSELPPTPLEITESVDFNRILEHRLPLLGIVYDHKTIGVDQKEHVRQVEEILLNDPTQNSFYQKILQLRTSA